MYTYGWRVGEVLGLSLAQVDLGARTSRLDPGQTKNGEGWTVYFTPELETLLLHQVERVRAMSTKLQRVIPYLFPNPLKGRFYGQQLRNFRKAWEVACQQAGVSGMIRHDLRRTAMRNLVRSGVTETVAMKITGHKTRSVFDRYNIVSEADLRQASHKLHGHSLGTNHESTLTPIPLTR